MSSADKQYLQLVKDILERGYYDKNRTGVNTYKLPHRILNFDLRMEFPILTTKFVAFKTCVKELLWIYRDQSNNVKLLNEQNVHIWDKWVDENYTIGTSYGFVVEKYKQIDKLIDGLINDPQGRRHILSLWQIPHLDGGTLYPCAFMTMWDVCDGFLNCMLIQRSGDVPLGIPFNMAQYAVLVHLIAHVTNLKPGLFTHVINNAHIYENQIEGMKMQLERENMDYDSPVLKLNNHIKNFYDFTIDDIILEDYKYHDAIKMEVSV